MDFTEESRPKKRERSENWTREERDALLDIIKSYRHILDNQSNNSSTIKLKNIVWNHITNRFHELSNKSRDVNQLRSFWKRLKMAARKRAKSKKNSLACDNEFQSFLGEENSNSQDEKVTSLDINSNLDKTTESDENTLFMRRCSTASSKGPEIILLLESNQHSDTKINEACSEDKAFEDNGVNLESSKYEADNSQDYDLFTPYMQTQKNDSSKERSESVDNDKRIEVPTGINRMKNEINYLQKEYMLKRYYIRLQHKTEMNLLNQRHQIQMKNLLLERKKIELEIARNKIELELSKKKL